MISQEEIIKNIKRDFFIYRNGVVADSLRKLYPPQTSIFGLTVPQFMEIAKRYPKDINLALKLWSEKNNRESRLLSFYLIPTQDLAKETALEIIKDLNSIEEADFLAFRVLRHLPYASELYQELSGYQNHSDIFTYFMKMFEKNLNQI